MQYIIMMTIEEKKEIKKKMPLKWVSVLSTETSFSKDYVRKVMSGRASHLLIEKKAIELALLYQKEIKEVEQLKASIL